MLLYHTRLRLFLGKLRSRWLNPFIVIEFYPHSAIEIQSVETNKIFNLNEHRLKAYYEKMPVEEINEVDLVDLIYTEA